MWTNGFDGPRNGEFGSFHRVLTPEIVPEPDAPWLDPETHLLDHLDAPLTDVVGFALSFDGYAAMGENLRHAANHAAEQWRKDGVVPETLVKLRSYLFYEQRRWRHFQRTPTEADLTYMRALIEAIRVYVSSGSVNSET